MAGFGQFAATSQFYLYGRSHCTSTGYETAMKKILKKGPDLLASPDLSMAGKVAIVTGANSGVGKEVAMFLAKKGAVVYMVCRSQERGEAARREIQEAAGGNPNVHLLICDMSLEADVRKMWLEFCEAQRGAAVCAPLLLVLESVEVQLAHRE